MTEYNLRNRLTVERISHDLMQLLVVCYVIKDRDDPDFDNNYEFLEQGLLRLKSDIDILQDKIN